MRAYFVAGQAVHDDPDREKLVRQAWQVDESVQIVQPDAQSRNRR